MNYAVKASPRQEIDSTLEQHHLSGGGGSLCLLKSIYPGGKSTIPTARGGIHDTYPQHNFQSSHQHGHFDPNPPQQKHSPCPLRSLPPSPNSSYTATPCRVYSASRFSASTACTSVGNRTDHSSAKKLSIRFPAPCPLTLQQPRARGTGGEGRSDVGRPSLTIRKAVGTEKNRHPSHVFVLA